MRLIRSTAVISAFTMMSRILGLVRDILMAQFLGAGIVNDVLITANKLPNLFRRMFAEGAFNAAFVPLYARRIEEDGDEAAAQFAGEALAALVFLVGAIVVVFQLTMPWSLNMIGGLHEKVVPTEEGFIPYDLAVFYARITMPYLFFMSVGALLSGMLNTRHYFAVAAFAPVLLNIVWIGVLLIAPHYGLGQRELAFYITIGITVSGLLQVLLLIWGLKRAAIRLPLKWPRLTPGVKRLFVLGVPGLIAAGITHINLMVTHLISTQMEGAPSWLYFSDRLYQLPLGMIGIAMGVALLPALSRSLRAGDEDGAMMSMNRALELSALLTLPAAVALAVIPEFLVGGLFERGAFMASDTAQTAKALFMFALGLPAFILIKVLTPAFFARENTRTPMRFAVMSAGVNLIFGALLFYTIGFYGLALATTLAAWANVLGLSLVLWRSGHFVPDRRLRSRLPRTLIAALIMGAALYAVRHTAQAGLTGGVVNDYSRLLLVCGGGAVIYAVAAVLLGAVRRGDLRDALKRPNAS